MVTHRNLLSILVLFFFLHLINLTLLPIFNDESIYLSWGWSAAHIPDRLYDSLTDAKGPLMIWLFGFAQTILPDPLFAGRFVSVLFGLGSVVGIYLLAKKVYSERTALFASLLFTVTPIFVFYNRIALMESAIICIGIWICYCTLQLIEQPTFKKAIGLGILFGVGFYIKASLLLFLLAFIFIVTFVGLKGRKKKLLLSVCITLGVFLLWDIALFVNPLFWQMLPTNSRYALTLGEILSFPISLWGQNITNFLAIGFFFFSPLAFLFAWYGSISSFRRKKYLQILFLAFYGIALCIELITTKSQIQRYLVPFLPFLTIGAASVLTQLWQKNFFTKLVVCITYIVPLILSIWLVVNPDAYIMKLSNYTKTAETYYVRGQTAGYGIHEVMDYLKATAPQDTPVMILYGRNSGNPENAMTLYTQYTNNMVGMYFDSNLFAGIQEYNCIKTAFPAYIITREDQQLGMNRFLVREKVFKNPGDAYSVQIYQINRTCTGKTADITPYYQASIDYLLGWRR